MVAIALAAATSATAARRIAFAADALASLLANPVLSDIIETEPAGEGLEDQPLYLNAALVGETSLDAARAARRAAGRSSGLRPHAAVPRRRAHARSRSDAVRRPTWSSEPGLEVPHPRFRERFFVLGPLAEIAPDMRDPVTGLKVWELLRALLRDREPVVASVPVQLGSSATDAQEKGRDEFPGPPVFRLRALTTATSCRPSSACRARWWSRSSARCRPASTSACSPAAVAHVGLGDDDQRRAFPLRDRHRLDGCAAAAHHLFLLSVPSSL